MPEYSREEVAKHNKEGDAWVIVQDDVYDVSMFANLHPGGTLTLLEYAGTDCTEVFYSYHRHDVVEKYKPRLFLGRVKGAGEPDEYNTIKSAADISDVPYAEPMYWRGFESPYLNESHKKFRAEVRKFVHTELREAAEEYELSGEAPSKEIFQKLGKFGLLAARIGPGPHLKYVDSLPAGIKPEEFDYFHECIAHEEIGRLGTPGFTDGIGSGMCIGLPPVLQFGPQWMKDKVGKEVLNGEKRICLAITEAKAGSDVAGIITRAEKTPDGKHFIVNGTKKWITNGHASDYFVTAVRTGGEGMGGISLLMIERSEGLETKKIKTSYSTSAGTAFVTYENVKVPVENLLGAENQGFVCIMYNFNHERWMIICYMMTSIRGAIEECFKWANQRKAFGKTLISQPVIRLKLAKMIAECESTYAWLESLTFQMNNMSYDMQSMRLAGTMSLLKYQSTRVAHNVADEAVQIFGGRAITQGGMGKMIERFQRTYKFGAILGGSEEIMADLGVKMAQKDFPSNAKL